MQVAAMNPSVVSRDQVDKKTVDRELEIYRTQAKNEGKKEQIIDKIAMGKLEKYYQEFCLLEQTFIKDPGKTIKDVLAEASQNLRQAGRRPPLHPLPPGRRGAISRHGPSAVQAGAAQTQR